MSIDWWTTAVTELRSAQPNCIPVDRSHDHRWVGKVIHLEVSAGGALVAVAEVDDHVGPEIGVVVGAELRHVATNVFWSVEGSRLAEGGDLVIDAIAITAAPASVGAQPLRFADGNVAVAASGATDWHTRQLLARAREANYKRHRGPLIVHGLEHGRAHHPTATLIETRSTGAVVDVNPRLREVDLLIAPAEVPATIHERGRTYSETFAHGCFADNTANPGAVKLNRDHQIARSIGRAVSIDAWSELGCIGTFRVSKVADGDEALELLGDGVAACSAGFTLPAGGDQWQSATSRRILRANLVHVAVTADPAHATSVLDVRRGDLLASV